MVYKLCNIADLVTLPTMDECIRERITGMVTTLSELYGENRNIDNDDGGFVVYTATTDNRPNFQKMISEAQNEPCWSRIIVVNYSRIFRDMNIDGYYRYVLHKLGIAIESATEDNSDTPEAVLARHVTSSFNAYFPKSCAVHTHASLKTKAGKCQHCGGKPPLGYDIKDEKLVINEYEAETVKLIKNIRADYIEKFICINIVKNIINKKNYLSYNDILKNNTSEASNASLRKELAGTEKAIANILKLLENHPSDEASKRFDSLVTKKREIQNKISAQSQIPQITTDNYKELRSKIAKELKISLSPVVYDILDKTIDRITVSNDGINIELNI